MKKQDVQELSLQLGVSKATVSKVINHCPGVDSETRKKVLDAVKQLNLKHENEGGCSIYIIVPENPKYFWSQAYKGLVDAADLSLCKFNIYSKLHDAEIVKLYLQQAYTEKAKVIIMAVAYNPELFELIEKISKEIPIFFLEEYHSIPNTFYFGSNAYEDGVLMGKAYLQYYDKYSHIVCLEQDDNPNLINRIAGFKDTVTRCTNRNFRTIQVPLYQKSLASLIARQLDEINKDSPFDFIYCVDGILPQVCLAINKLNLKHEVICVGFENPGFDNIYMNKVNIGAIIEQDIYTQGKEAMRYAVEYIKTLSLPPSKHVYIPSRFIR